MKRSLPEKCALILKKPTLLEKHAKSSSARRRAFSALKIALLFAAAGLFVFFLTVADYQSGSLSAYGEGGLFSVKEFGGRVFITLFGSETSFPLPEIVIAVKDALSAFFASF